MSQIGLRKNKLYDLELLITGIIVDEIAVWLSVGIGSGIAFGVAIGAVLEYKKSNNKKSNILK